MQATAPWSGAKTEGTFNERLILLLLSSVQFITILDFVIMMPLGPQFMRSFSIGPSEFGLMVSAYTWSGAVAGLAAGSFMDRFDRRRSMLVLFFGFLIGTGLCAVAPDHHFFVWARMITGMFAGLLGATVFAIIGDVFPEQRRGRAMGIVMSSFSLASILGLPLGLWLANISSWNAPFIALVVAGCLVWALAFYALPALRGHVEAARGRSYLQQLRDVLGHRQHLWALSLTAFTVIGQFSVIPYISVYMVSNAGYPEHLLPLVYLSGGALTFFSSRYVGRWSDRLGKAAVFQRMLMLSLIPLLMVTHLPPVPVWVALVVSAFFMISISGRMVPMMALVTGVVPPRLRGSFMSVNTAVQHLSSGTAAYVAGLMISKGEGGEVLHYNQVGYLAVTSSLVAFFIVLRLHRK